MMTVVKVMMTWKTNWLPLLSDDLTKELLNSNAYLLIIPAGIVHQDTEGSKEGEFERTDPNEQEGEQLVLSYHF
jgi:uncharacterized RmlC-like cupin family protein